jgi:hypothetical protein
MKKDLIKFALVGLVAGFCLSAAAAPSNKDSKEIAMTKCTKDESKKKNGNGNDDKGNGSCSSCNSQGDQSNASSQVKGKRKSAAHKVLYGK